MAGEKRILIVEDDEGDLEYIQEILADEQIPQRYGITYTTDCAYRISEALSLLEPRAYDLILLDLSLPDSTGLDTLTSVSKRAPDIPIIILTGLNDMEFSMQALEQGASHYLVKGFIDRDELVRIITDVIKNYGNWKKFGV